MWIRLELIVIMAQMLTTVCPFPLENIQSFIDQYINYGKDELKDTFGVGDTSKVPEHDLVWPTAEYTTDEDGQRVINRLLLHSNRSFSIPLRLIDDPVQIGSKRKCHYQSSGDEVDTDVSAAVSNCDGQLRGTIITGTEVFTLHPLPKPRQKYGPFVNESSENQSQFMTHVLIKRQSLTGSAEESSRTSDFCGLEGDHAVSSMARDSPILDAVRSQARRISVESTMTAEMAIFVDYEMYKKHYSLYGAQAETRLQDFVSTIFNNIQILYNHPTMKYQISFKIVRYEVFKTQPDPLIGARHRDGDAQMYLDNFCTYQYGARGRNWDQAFLITGYDIHRNYGSDKSISGIARLYGACDPYNSCVLVEGHDFTSVYIATHELGHGFGMRHDEPYCSSTFIMSGSLGPGKVTWSQCSMSDMGKYISKLENNGKNCLRQTNGYAAMTIDMSSLPGQRYDADRQCAMMHGSGYRHVIPRNQYAEGACSMMWCGQSTYGRIITAHPALEGSICGENRYCLRGQCLSWASGPRQSPPRPLDGVWTDWFRPSCSDCVCAPFTGSLGILQATRTCSNPPPSNGGRECPGDPVRGIVCNANCPATHDTVEAYIDRQCHWRLGQGRDPEMTGRGAQLTKDIERACKVFCDIRPSSTGKNYRFYGDLVPDGSPCGQGRWCVAGQCLLLSCDGNGLVHDSASCPTVSERCAITPPRSPQVTPTQAVISTSSVAGPQEWTEWSSWSICSVTCGRGQSSRRRLCPSGASCPGLAVDTKDCDAPKCPAAGWTTWSIWSDCSASCEKGIQSRYRRCLGNTCNEPSEERRICNNGPCDNSLKNREETHWTSWSTWTACSVPCGEGTQTRSRACSGRCGPNAFEKSREMRPCYQAPCAQWGAWGAWSECYDSTGVQTRLRNCYSVGHCPGQTGDSGSDSQTRPCSRAGIPFGANSTGGKWLSWGSWTPCTRSCGGGTRTRYRLCASTRKGACVGDQNQSEECSKHECFNVRFSRGTALRFFTARLSRPKRND